MKKLLLNSLIIIAVIILISCTNTRKINTTTTEITKGDSITAQSSDTIGSKKGDHYKEMNIKHISPEQAKIDSIKKAKTKKKIK